MSAPVGSERAEGDLTRAPGQVVWITGLAASGKTTVSRALAAAYRARTRPPVLLDGDELRFLLPVAPGYTRPSRLRVAEFYGALAGRLAAQGHLVIVATISLMHEVHARNRAELPGYFEVLLQVPRDELERRAAARPSASSPAVGAEIPADMPTAPDLVIENWGERSSQRSADLILQALGTGGGSA